jgi:hypothetical protein
LEASFSRLQATVRFRRNERDCAPRALPAPVVTALRLGVTAGLAAVIVFLLTPLLRPESTVVESLRPVELHRATTTHPDSVLPPGFARFRLDMIDLSPEIDVSIPDFDHSQFPGYETVGVPPDPTAIPRGRPPFSGGVMQ